MIRGGVLPLKTTGEREARSLAHARNLLRTLDHFWTDPAPFALTIVVPDKEVRSVARALPSTERLAITVLPESRILKNARLYPGLHGWFRQMAIKIGFAPLAPSPYYITFDADVLCVRPFDSMTFMREGRAITEWEPVAWHPEWWVNTSAVLAMPMPEPVDVLGVTPNFFSREIANDCIAQLGRAGPGPWDANFAAGSDIETRQTSDLALYTLAGMQTGKLMQLHWGRDVPEDWPRVHAPIHLWTREQYPFEDWHPSWWVANHPNGHFVVVQSTAGYDPAAIIARLEELLAIPVERPPAVPRAPSKRGFVGRLFKR